MREMNGWTFFQYSIFSSLKKKSERENNVDFFLPCYLIEIYETVNFKCFNNKHTNYHLCPPNPASLKNDFVPFSP